MARPVSFTKVFDIPLSDSEDDIIIAVPGSVVSEPSLVQVALNGETADVTAQVSIGGAQVLPQSNVTVQATAGVLPVTPDDILVTSFGNSSERITIRGTNVDAAAARELRAKVTVFPTSDIAIVAQMLRQVGIPVS